MYSKGSSSLSYEHPRLTTFPTSKFPPPKPSVVLQLSILGYILVPIFSINKAWLSCLYMVFMLLVATIESVSRPAQTYEGMLWQVLVALGAPSSAMLAYGLGVVVRPSPWYEAQYLVPVMGMLLGNACSGVAVGLSTLLDDLSGGRDRVEQLLALGATRLEAAQDAIRRAARMALTPTINQMNVAGIVAIPGMMTGQILGGADPTTAARYQIVLLLLIAATSGMGSVGAIFFATFTLLDSKARLRSDRLHPREATGKGVGLWIATQCKHAWRFATGQKKKKPTEKRDERGRSGPARHEDEDEKTPEVVVDKNGGHRNADDQSSSSSSDIRRPLLQGRDK